MQYIKKNLLRREKLIYIVRPHWVVFSSAIWTFAISIYLLLFPIPMLSNKIFNHWDASQLIVTVLLFIGFYYFVSAYIYFLTSEYGVTNKRVMIKVGWIQRKSLEIMIEKIEGVLVDQSIIGRLLSYGIITIIGTGGTKDSFPYIPNPLQFRRAVQQQIDSIEDSKRAAE